MTTITLTKDATTITLPGPDGPTDANLRPQYVTGLSQGGQTWSYRVTSRKTLEWSLKLDSLTASDRAALESFYNATVLGPTNTFTYTHTNGAQYTARFLNVDLRFRRVSSNEFGTEIRLELAEPSLS